VLQNPGSPLSVALPLVGLCTRAELLELARGADVPPVLRITAGELAERRPPMSQPAPEGDSEPDSAPDSDGESEFDSDEPGPLLQ
jgi:hypothetical protein